MCALSDIDCEKKASAYTLPNNCSLNLPYRCNEENPGHTLPNHGCVKDIRACKFTVKCPSAKPVLCADKSCAATAAECMKQAFQCKKNQVQCVDQSCRDTWADCLSLDGCPIDKPFRCPDGSCKPT